MIIYMIDRAILKIRNNLKIYIFLILEMAIGITFITYTLNHVFSYQDTRSRIYKIYNQHSYALVINHKNENNNDIPLNLADLDQINNISDNRSHLFITKQNACYINDELQNYYLIYCDLELFGLDEANVYGGSNVWAYILDKNTTFVPSDHIISPGHFKINDTDYSLKKIPDHIEDTYLEMNYYNYLNDLSNCILLPIKEYGDITPVDRMDLNLVIEADKEGKVLNEVESFLEQNYSGSYTYTFRNIIDDYESRGGYSLEIARYLGNMAVIMIIILIFGFLGVLYLFIKRREYETAVCIAVGAKISYVIFEFLLEVSFVIGMGCLLGIISGSVISDHLNFMDAYELKMGDKTYLTDVMIYLTFVSIITFRFLYYIRNTNLLVLLNGEEGDF